MIQVGITGGIGTGKSTVCQIFASLGIPVMNTDDLAKKILNTNTILQQKVMQQFGEEVFIDGVLQNKILAAKAFTNATNTAKLNAIVHPYVYAAIDDWTINQNTSYTIRESALLIESESYKKLDILIGVQSPMDIRLQRIIQRDACSLEKAKERIALQLTEEDKEKYYHYKILNYPPHLIIPQVLQIHQTILQRTYK
jgi:dephospho-CoA kinase